jgi:hypothetical protein
MRSVAALSVVMQSHFVFCSLVGLEARDFVRMLYTFTSLQDTKNCNSKF